MKAARLVLLLLVMLIFPMRASAWVDHAQLPSSAGVVSMAAPTTDAVSLASHEAALERSDPLAMENEVQSRLICDGCALAITGACALASEADQSARMWRTYHVILPGMVTADAAVERSSSHHAKGTQAHLML